MTKIIFFFREGKNYNWRWEGERREMKKNFFRKRSKRGNIKWIKEVWVNQLREGKWVRFEFEIQIDKSYKVKKDKSRKSFSLIQNDEYALQCKSWNSIWSGVM